MVAINKAYISPTKERVTTQHRCYRELDGVPFSNLQV